MKIKFTFGPYGYEVVLGNITEKIYNKYSQDNIYIWWNCLPTTKNCTS